MEKESGRVCIVIPDSPFLADSRTLPSLGSLAVAAELKRQKIPVDVLDLNAIKNSDDVIQQYCQQSDTNIFALGCTSPQLPLARQAIEAIRAYKPEAKCVLGGPHVTLTYADYKREQKLGIDGRAHKSFRIMSELADCLISGDGQTGLMEALRSGFPSIIDGDDPNSPYWIKEEDLGGYDWPDRSLIDMDSYNFNIDGVRATHLIGMLACPYMCSFCGGRLSPSFRRTRKRPVSDIIGEVENIYRNYGYLGYFLAEDEANLPNNFVDYMNSFVNLQEKLGVSFSLRAFAKANLLTESQAEAMARAGLKKLLIGFESGSEKILTNIQKKSTKAQNTRAVEICRKYGISVKFLMSIGHAGEDFFTIKETHQWLLDMEPDEVDITIITVYPSVPYSSYAIAHPTEEDTWVYTAKNGDVLFFRETDFSRDSAFYKGIPGEYSSLVWTPHLSREDIVELRNWMEEDLRTKLKIPYPIITPSQRHEASMGMLPGYIYRSS